MDWQQNILNSGVKNGFIKLGQIYLPIWHWVIVLLLLEDSLEIMIFHQDLQDLQG